MIHIIREPRAGVYRALLAHALHRAAHFSLVWREQLSFQHSAELVAASLKPFLADERVTDEWPGTQLFASNAVVRRYTLCASSIGFLEAPGRLFAWRDPCLPEDLAFYLPSGACWLGSISHERDAWINEAAGSLPALLHAIPGLSAKVAA
jgi:hypothetical protein